MKRNTSSNGSAGGEWSKLNEQIDAIQEKINAAEDRLYMLEIALQDHLQTAIIDAINDPDETADVSSPDAWHGYELALQRAGKIAAWARGISEESDALRKQQEELEQQQNELGMPPEVRRRRHGQDTRERAAQS